MSFQRRKIFWRTLVALISFAVAALVLAKTRTLPPASSSLPISSATPNAPITRAPRTSRNLSHQPEAFTFSRLLGKRFSSSTHEKSILVGMLHIGSEKRIVQTIRSQTDDGEQVEIRIAGTPGPLTWDKDQGALSSQSRATGENREVIERLVFDSPDQFVLSQLRGASYRIVGRNVRPADAVEPYSGPIWTIMRVDDPETDSQKKPKSTWRLFYINTASGLIDRIVSEIDGVRIFAEISGWGEASGEKVPSDITWIHDGQTVMSYHLTDFSHTEQ